MKKAFLKVALFAALLNVSLTYTSCSKEDDSPAQSNQEVTGGTTDKTSDEKTDDVVLVSELKCTVEEFATKYTTLKKGEKVNVTITDVSDANISKLAQTLQKMSATTISKAASDDNYIVVLVLESKDELTKILAEVFKDCKAIVSVTIPECVELIENGAFKGCTALETVKILSEITQVHEGAFAENVKIEGGTQTEDVVTPEIYLLSPADIVDYVNASDEEIVTLNMALETYDHTDVMLEIAKITDKKVKLVIPDGVKELSVVEDKLSKNEWGNAIYPMPKALVEVEIPEGVTSIGDNAFYFCRGLTSITIPDGVTSIGESAFSDCYGLTSITIPEGVTSIGASAFSDCSSLTSITIPDGVTSIGDYAFSYCSGLTSITIPEGVTSIGNGAFYYCGLTSITILEGVTSIGDWAFSYCSFLISITIPDGVTSIGDYAFSYCIFLHSITIPEGVTSIGEEAFQSCIYLHSITIPDGVTSIGNYAFRDCSDLTSITIPEGVTSIGDYAFSYCSGLTSITIPESVTEIGSFAFANCNNLQTIYCSQAVYDKYHETYPQMVVKE